jgi:energy-coupling factor transport system ATP-binding protein
MIVLEKLAYGVRRTEILHGIDLTIRPGEFVALVGPNGAGKTTLLKHLNGLLKPSSGRVLVEGQDTRQVPTAVLARRIGFLFQNPDQQILCATVREELAFGLKHCGVPKPEWEGRIAAAAAQVDLGALLDADPLLLPRSRRQRVALASVLAADPDLLVLDEPTSAQDEAETTRIMELARGRVGAGKTVILVSHDMELVARYADRAIALIDGRVVADARPRELFADAALLERAKLDRPGLYRLADALGLDWPDRRYAASALVDALDARLGEAV